MKSTGGRRKSKRNDDTRFLLVKWYMDCVGADGSVVVGYAASLYWNSLKLNYSGVLDYSEKEGIHQDSSWRKRAFPVIESDLMRWSPAHLHFRGTWKSIDEPIYQTLIENDSGFVQWDCFQPRTLTNVQMFDHKISDALGYAERLLLTIKPWELKIKELRWGRFLSNEDTLIWIQLSGKDPVNLLFYNNKLVGDAIVGEYSVYSPKLDLKLEISDPVSLRKGTLQKNVFGNAQDILEFFPLRILHAKESKWRSRGVLIKKNGFKTYGWVIHEVVLWK